MKTIVSLLHNPVIYLPHLRKGMRDGHSSLKYSIDILIE